MGVPQPLAKQVDETGTAVQAVVVVDPVTPSRQLTVNADGSINTSGGGGGGSNASVGVDGSAIPLSSTLIGGSDGTNLQPLQVDASKYLKVNVAAGSLTASNPSVGTDGSAIPASSTLIGGSDGTNLQPLQVDASKNLKVVDTNSSAMKTDLDSIVTNTTGIATAANQSTGNTSLATIATNTTGLATQTTAAAMKADLDSIVTNTTGVATAANQSTANTSLSTISTNTGNTATGIGGVADAAASNSTSSWSIIALLKGLYALLAGSISIKQPTSATGTLTSVAGTTATSTQLLASNTSRKGVFLFNDSTAVLYLGFNATVTTTSYSVQIPANGFFEMPVAPVYTGVIAGVWSAANGNARITELT